MKKWYRLALFNLVVLAFLGSVLRYKINFPLEIIQQENLLHAHSHFAFNGWVGFLLQVLILGEFSEGYKKAALFWDRFFLAGTLLNYAMAASFLWTGYSPLSIACSTGALWLTYVFSRKIYASLPPKRPQQVSIYFIKAALFFLLLSSLGPYALAAIMVSKSSHQYLYHNALYFFLHFQYNGWFTFSVLGLLTKKLENSAAFNRKTARIFFFLMAGTCIPSYLFTSLWRHRPSLVTGIIVVSAVLQTAALFFYGSCCTGT
ncbi:MAG: hypothetical protein INR73_20225 [Williamsia sp.]|nr:hypothetical protein [Williamsia sp.]